MSAGRATDSVHPPLEGEGREPTGPRKARPDDRLRERDGVNFEREAHPTPPAFAALKPSTLPLQGRVDGVRGAWHAQRQEIKR